MKEYFRMECDCPVYEENMLYIDSGCESLVRHGFKSDDFIIFKYCPWCGKKLIKIPLSKSISLKRAQRCSYNLHMHMPTDSSLWKSFFDIGKK